jgi:GxxExxY protein
MRTESELDELSHKILGAGIMVHSRCGPGCFETTYAPCLAYELARRHLRFEMGVWMDLVYDDLVVPRAYQVDVLVEDVIVIEIKAIEALGRVHLRQLLTYLRLTGLPLGLVLNFGAATMPEGTKRVVNNFPHGTTPIGRRSRVTTS